MDSRFFGGHSGDKDQENTFREENDTSAWKDDSWKKDDTISGWVNEEDGWGVPEQEDTANEDIIGSEGNFLIRKLGLDTKSIFEGPKTLTR